MARFTQEELKQIYNTDIFSVAVSLGFEFGTKDSSWTKVKDHGGLYINNSGKGFYCHSRGFGGNVVDFVKEFGGARTFSEAANIILGERDSVRNADLDFSKLLAKKIPDNERVFEKPDIDTENGKRVFAYLIKTRKIDAEIVTECFKRKIIFAARSEVNGKTFTYAAFAGYDPKGEMRHCFLRSVYTNSSFKQDCIGSDKNYPFKILGSSNKVYVFEAAIDAVSHASMSKAKGQNWREDTRMALAGTSNKALETFLKENNRIKEIVFCLDNDMELEGSGEWNIGQTAARKYAKEYKALGYKTYIQKPFCKDFNEDLTEGMSLSDEAEYAAGDELGCDLEQEDSFELEM